MWYDLIPIVITVVAGLVSLGMLVWVIQDMEKHVNITKM